jgi:hypothetical protein
MDTQVANIDAYGGGTAIEIESVPADRDEPKNWANSMLPSGTYGGFERYVYMHGDQGNYGHVFAFDVENFDGMETFWQMDEQSQSHPNGLATYRGRLPRKITTEDFAHTDGWQSYVLDEARRYEPEQLPGPKNYHIGVNGRPLYERQVVMNPRRHWMDELADLE